VKKLRLFEAFEDTVSVVQKVNPDAAPDAAVAQAIVRASCSTFPRRRCKTVYSNGR
jgi:hypothetical protein